MPISIRLFWNFFLKPSNGFGLFVSTLHEAGSLLLFFLAPSCFLLSFLKGFTCHKTSISVRGARSRRYVRRTAFFPSDCFMLFSHVESLVNLFLGRTSCFSHDF